MNVVPLSLRFPSVVDLTFKIDFVPNAADEWFRFWS